MRRDPRFMPHFIPRLSEDTERLRFILPVVPLPSELISSAADGDHHAITQLLAYYYPPVYRLSAGITGSRTRATRNAQRVLVRAMSTLHGWEDPQEVNHWFMRQTIQQLRARRFRRPKLAEDLLAGAGPNDPAFHAFIRSLRLLPLQQQEAIFLRDGERLDTRVTAIATDCSTQAAGTHYEAAKTALRELSGATLESMMAVTLQAYYLLTPETNLVLPAVERGIRRHVWPKRVKAVATALTLLATFYGLYYAYRYLLPMLDL